MICVQVDFGGQFDQIVDLVDVFVFGEVGGYELFFYFVLQFFGFCEVQQFVCFDGVGVFQQVEVVLQVCVCGYVCDVGQYLFDLFLWYFFVVGEEVDFVVVEVDGGVG